MYALKDQIRVVAINGKQNIITILKHDDVNHSLMVDVKVVEIVSIASRNANRFALTAIGPLKNHMIAEV